MALCPGPLACGRGGATVVRPCPPETQAAVLRALPSPALGASGSCLLFFLPLTNLGWRTVEGGVLISAGVCLVPCSWLARASVGLLSDVSGRRSSLRGARAEACPLRCSLLKAAPKVPTTPVKAKRVSTFQEFESNTSDAWDAGEDDDELLAMAAESLNSAVVMETAHRVLRNHSQRQGRHRPREAAEPEQTPEPSPEPPVVPSGDLRLVKSVSESHASSPPGGRGGLRAGGGPLPGLGASPWAGGPVLSCSCQALGGSCGPASSCTSSCPPGGAWLLSWGDRAGARGLLGGPRPPQDPWLLQGTFPVEGPGQPRARGLGLLGHFQ